MTAGGEGVAGPVWSTHRHCWPIGEVRGGSQALSGLQAGLGHGREGGPGWTPEPPGPASLSGRGARRVRGARQDYHVTSQECPASSTSAQRSPQVGSADQHSSGPLATEAGRDP